MPTVTFKYEGQRFKANVPDGFADLPTETQQSRLYQALDAKYGDKPVPEKKDKNILDYIALLERPIQAGKVGLKESAIGGALYRSFGGVDLTPSEGFWQGAAKGWMGKDEIRTQDALPENLNPVLKGILGFAGDVVTDPLTWYGPALVRGAGALIKGASDVTGATPVVRRGGEAILNAKLPAGEKTRTVRDALRAFNVPTGRGKEVKGLASISDRNEFQDRVRIALSTGVEDLERFFNRRAEELNVSVEDVKKAFREAMERENNTEIVYKDGKIQFLEDAEGSFLLDGLGNKIPKRKILGRKPIGTKQQRLLGDEGAEHVQSWEDIFEEASKYSQAYGQPIRDITSKGYFPRVITREWKDFAEDLKVTEMDDDLLDPVFGATYRSPRTAYRDDPIDIASDNLKRDYLQKYQDRVGGTANPADVPFFELDPIVAMGSRLDRQARALQRKWFVDEITDSGYVTGPMLTREMTSKLISNYQKARGSAFNDQGQLSDAFLDDVYKLSRGDTADLDWVDEEILAQGVNFKPERNIGKWVRKVKDDKGNVQFQERRVYESWRGRLDQDNDQFTWEDMTPEERSAFLAKDGYESVKGVPKGYISKQQYNDVWDSAFLQAADDIGNLNPSILRSILDDKVRDADEIEFFVQSLDRKTKGTTRSAYGRAADKADQAVKRLGENMGTEEFYAPQAIRRQIEDTLDVMSGPKSNEFIRFYDKLQNAWKSWSLGVRPAYHTRNAIGNMWNAYMIAGVNSHKPFFDAAKLQYYGRFDGSEARRKELVENMGGVKGPLHDVSRINDKEWTQKFADTGFTMQELYTGARMRGVTAGHYTKDTIRDMELALAVRSGKGNFFDRFIGAENPFVRGGFAVGGTIEGNARFGVFINALQKMQKNQGDYTWVAPDGKKFKISDKTPEGYYKTETSVYPDRHINTNVPITKEDMMMDVAAQEVKAALFDYGDVSRFEQNVLKRFMPFYTWSRKNIPVQFKKLIQNPERAEKLAIAKQQFEHETGDLTYSDYGKFWGERVPVFLGNENDGVVKAFTLLNLLPMADLQRVLSPVALLNDLVTPMIKQPFEQIADYDTFRSTAQRRVSVTGIPGEKKDFLGVALPPRLYHLAQLLVPLTDLNRWNPGGIFGKNILDPATGATIEKSDAYFGLGASRETYKDMNEMARWIRFFGGVAFYDVNLNRTRYFLNKNLKKDIAELKGSVKYRALKGENRKLENLYDLLDAVEKGETVDPYEKRS